MKQVIITMLVAITLVACTQEDYDGPVGAPKAISFESTTGAMTRADRTGSLAASDLGYSFVVYGVKNNTTSYSDSKPVFDYYNVEFKAGGVGDLPTQYKGWDYVDIPPVNDNESGTTVVNDFPAVNLQSLKYWDETHSRYDFFAFSRGKGTDAGDATTYATFSTLNLNNVGSAVESEYPVFSIYGNQKELGAVYVSDHLTMYNESEPYEDQGAVKPRFRKVTAMVRIGLYETVPGYSVKDVKFYASDDSETPSPTPCIYAADGNGFIQVMGENTTMDVYFPDDCGVPKVKLAEGTFTTSETLTFDPLYYTGRELKESQGMMYLGRTSATATYSSLISRDSYVAVYSTGEQHDMKLKVDFTLAPIDGTVPKDNTGNKTSREDTTKDYGEIKMTGVTAVVPGIYTHWLPNYAYTYLFKISDQSGDGLYPISFDAVEVVDASSQESVSGVSDVSITTYQKGVNASVNTEYLPGQPIYITAADKSDPYLTMQTDERNEAGYVSLFTATVENGAVQDIVESSVANCLANGKYDEDSHTYTVTDINGKTLVLTAASAELSLETQIPAEDTWDGTAIDVPDGSIGKIATPQASTVYVFQYRDANGNYTYKVIKVTQNNEE